MINLLESVSLELLFVALDRFDAFVNVKDSLLVTDVAAKQLIMTENWRACYVRRRNHLKTF